MTKLVATLTIVALLAIQSGPTFAASSKPKGKVVSVVTTSITYGCSKKHR